MPAPYLGGRAPVIDPAILQKLAAAGEGLKALADMFDSGEKALPSGTPTTNYMTGPGGIFGVSGLEAPLIHTMIHPMGLASELPAFGSNRMDPLFPYLTGVRAETGVTKDGVCDDPQTAGLIKSCLQTATYGRYEVQSKEIELNRLGQQTDRGEFQDLRLINSPLMQILSPITPQTPGGQNAMNDIAMSMMPMGLYFQRTIGRHTFSGSPANNSAGGGYKEFPGADTLIGTGKVDALTGTACPSLDSDIKNANYRCVGSGAAANQALVDQMTYMWRYVRHIAMQTGLMPATWTWVMRPDLFYEITAIWPCSYLTYRCILTTGGEERINIDAGDAVAMRDTMRQGSYLVIDGMQVRVIQDSFIPEENSANQGNLLDGQFASDIYLVPLTIIGGLPATFWEFYNFSEANAAASAIREGNYASHYWMSDGGRFLWHNKPPTNWCIQWIAKCEPRLRLSTPHLAGRVQNVCYSPLQHTRDPLPADGYFVNGGEVGRAAPSYYESFA